MYLKIPLQNMNQFIYRIYETIMLLSFFNISPARPAASEDNRPTKDIFSNLFYAILQIIDIIHIWSRL